MKELCECLRNAILSAILQDNLVLAYLPLKGQGNTIPCRVSSSNNGTFTNSAWKTLKNGLVVPSFSGTNYIKNATQNWRSVDPQGAIGVFFRATGTGNMALVFSSDEATVLYYIGLYIASTTNLLTFNQRNNDTTDRITGGTAVTKNIWHSAFVTSNGSAWSLLLDGVVLALTVTSGANKGDWFADTSNRKNITSGIQVHTSSGFPFSGQIGAMVVYSVAPTTTQILRMHNRLKEVFR